MLVKYEAARAALAAAHRIDEVKTIRDKATALAAYAKQAQDADLITWATEIKARAERRAGELLKAMPKNGGGNPKLTPSEKEGVDSPPPTLAELGISYKDSMSWQKLAAIPEPVFEAAIAEAKASGKPLSTRALIGGKWTVAQYRQHMREVIKENREAERRGDWDKYKWGGLVQELEWVEERIREALVKSGYNEKRKKVLEMLKRLVMLMENDGGAQ